MPDFVCRGAIWMVNNYRCAKVRSFCCVRTNNVVENVPFKGLQGIFFI